MGKPWENHGKMVIYMERSTIFDGDLSTKNRLGYFQEQTVGKQRLGILDSKPKLEKTTFWTALPTNNAI